MNHSNIKNLLRDCLPKRWWCKPICKSNVQYQNSNIYTGTNYCNWLCGSVQTFAFSGVYTIYSKYSFYNQGTNGWHWMQYKRSVTEQTLVSWMTRSSNCLLYILVQQWTEEKMFSSHHILAKSFCQQVMLQSPQKHVKWGNSNEQTAIEKHLEQKKFWWPDNDCLCNDCMHVFSVGIC